MAVHDTLLSLVQSTLREYLVASRLSLEYRKRVPEWPVKDDHGCLGMASALMLLCVVDVLGSYLRQTEVMIPVDGKKRKIKNNNYEHFFVLNSTYYGESLSENDIKDLYKKYRNLIAHNAALSPGHSVLFDPAESECFPVRNGIRMINLPPLHAACCKAVESFLDSPPNITETVAARDIEKKAHRAANQGVAPDAATRDTGS